jgi:hypothetical protein
MKTTRKRKMIADILPSWNDAKAKQSIIEFVAKVTKEGSPDFVPPTERVAVFDNDGTLWCEQPFYFQGLFAFDRIKALAPQHAEWGERQRFKAVLDNDMKALAAAGEKGLLELVMVSHAGNTTEEFQAIVKDWLATAKHPRFQRPYHELVYQPMVELLNYLRANGFKTFIVSGGRDRVHAAVGGGNLRHPSRASHRQQHRHQVRDARRQSRASALARSQLH